MAIIFNSPLGFEKPPVEVTDPETGEKQGEGGNLDEALRNAGRDDEYNRRVVEELTKLLPEDGGETVDIENDAGLPKQEKVDAFVDRVLEEEGGYPEGGGNIEIGKEGIKNWAKFVGKIMRDKEVALPIRLAGAAFLWAAYAFEMVNALANKLDEKLTARQIVERYRETEKDLDK